MNELHIRDPEEILRIINVSYGQKKVDFFRKNSLSPDPNSLL